MCLTQAFPSNGTAEQMSVPQQPVERFTDAHGASRAHLTFTFFSWMVMIRQQWKQT